MKELFRNCETNEKNSRTHDILGIVKAYNFFSAQPDYVIS